MRKSIIISIRLETDNFKLLEEARRKSKRNDFIKICILEKLARIAMKK